MIDGMYTIRANAQCETPCPDGAAMLICNNGFAFIEIHPAVGDAKELRKQTEMLEKIETSPTMKEHERIFFALCYSLRDIMKPRDVVNALAETIPHKRCWYYLDKWGRLGFYSSGVAADLGWFYPEKLPQRYMEIVNGKEGAK